MARRGVATVARWLLVAAVLLAVAGGGAAPADAGAPPSDPADGLTVTGSDSVSDRLTEYTVASPALGREAVVRVQLPTGYHDDPDRRWPMALLLHGRSEDGTTWSERTDLEQFDGMVIVTPDGGRVGWYTDWYDDSCCEVQRWETFHIRELLPWAEATFRLTSGRSQRFVAGDSMGGFGAMSYAARHPDLFGGAAELSGFVDLMLLESSGVIGVDGQTYQVAGVPPGSIFGPKETEEVRWRGHNPVDLAPNLAGTDLVLRHGNGLPGQFGGNPDPGEAAIRLTGVSFHERLDELGIEHLWDDYGDGVHTWPYWEWGLQVTWPRWQAIAAAASPDVDAPSPFSYRSMEPEWSVFGWNVAFERDVLEFAEFTEVTTDGFSLTGSGVATVTTPGRYPPGSPLDVTVTGGPDGEAQVTTVVANATGRLRFEVDLGPSNTVQQYTPPADAQQAILGNDYFTTAEITITPRPGPGSAPNEPEDSAAPDPLRDAPALPTTGGGAILAGFGALVGSLVAAQRRYSRLG